MKEKVVLLLLLFFVLVSCQKQKNNEEIIVIHPSNLVGVLEFEKTLLDWQKEQWQTHPPDFRKPVKIEEIVEPVTPSKTTAVVAIKNPDSITVLVNKRFRLAKSYVPSDLVAPLVPFNNRTPKLLRAQAALALESLFAQALQFGYELVAVSGYRSYQSQEIIYNRYVDRYGKKQADTFSAQPGHSEHQLGLAMDISSPVFNNAITRDFGNWVGGQWVNDNAHLFGFIIRYPKDKQAITGYIYEPWHLRYVGKELANTLYQCQCTMEEYFNKRP